ncbi:hypothetical protein [Enterovibrio norvegicus]|uniref:O-antigen polymerase n=1 Tax=Enterovibrio norvegicus TaxID=188144 RepID=A0A2N7LDL6_9GAMM|nr:hypothetical protein [Enterovibrio norvegicus]PML75584.1 hypothetical protein BCT69_06395 [Enterovibrio norvegicus]PMN93494.1 hypothetical protein BCT23_12610 [Enterovibrio norvegicus]
MKVLKRVNVSDFFISFSAFLTLNLPTVKYFVKLEAFNVIPVLILMFVALIKGKVKIKYGRSLGLITLILVFFVSLLIYGIFSNKSFDLFYLTKYLVIVLNCVLVYFLFNKYCLEVFLKLNLYWGAGLALLYQLSMIDMNVINYLQLGHPVAASLIISIISLINFRSIRPFNITSSILIILVTMLCLLGLYGRSPLLFPIFVVVSYILAAAFRKNPLIGGGVSFFVLVFTVYIAEFLLDNLPPQIQYRLMDIDQNFAEEPRIITWLDAISHISINPFGYGPEASLHLLGYVPHNFLIESGISLGIIGMFLVLIIYAIILFSINISFAQETSHKVIACITLYYFFRYQIGGAIGSSYDLLILALVLVICSQKTLDINNKGCENDKVCS